MQQAFTKFFGVLLSCTAIILLNIVVNAQFRAGLQGTVTDSGGGLVSGATVTLTSNETQRSQTVITSEEGFYRFSSLAPGSYTITVEQANFKKQILEEVTVSGENIQGLNITLAAGGISETVTVTNDETPALETEDANIRKVLTTDEVLKLPQSGRDPYELARLAPGVFGSGARSGSGGSVSLPNTSGPGGSNSSIFQTENQVPITANGQRVSANNYQIDGTSVNSQNWGGAAIVTPSQESVKEVQVTSSSYSAEDGRNSGAQIKVVTQNGTNQWQGSAFFKLNDPSLNAFNKFPSFIGTTRTTGPTRVEQKFKSYGGSAGGPILKDRLFFFFAYEGTKNNTNTPYFSFIETSSYRQQLTASRSGTVAGQVISAAGIDPRVLQIIPVTCASARTVTPALSGDIRCQDAGGGLDLGSITGLYNQYVARDSIGNGFDGIADLQYAQLDNPQKYRAQQFFTRIDYNVTDKDKVAFTSIFTPTKSTNADSAAQSRPQADFNSNRLNFAVGAIYIRNISSSMLNEARFNISGWGFNEVDSNPQANFGLPRVEIEQVFDGRLRFGIGTPGNFKDRQLDFRDTLTNIVGNHVLKFGAEYRRDLNRGGSLGVARPSYSFTRVWNFANGTPVFESVAANSDGKPSPDAVKYHTSSLAFFVQDDWKFRPNLTLNLGLRWEYFSPITADGGSKIGNLVLDSNGGLAGARIETNKKLTDSDYNNFGPQIGFAWSPERLKSKAVVRGGFGIGYDRLANALLNNARRNPPSVTLFGLCCGDPGNPFANNQIKFDASSDGTILGYPVNGNIGGGFNSTTGLPNSGSIEIYASPRNLPNSYVYRYSLEGQYELPFKSIAVLGYQGSAGHKFVRIDRVHITGPSTNPRIFAAYFAAPDVNSNFNAMLASLRNRFYKGLDFNINYRYSKSIDTASFEAPCGCTDQSYPIDQREERGPSDFDVRHNMTASVVWDLPIFRKQSSAVGKILGGWQVSSIISYNTGFPWTPKIFNDLRGPNGNSFGNIRPVRYFGGQPLNNSNDNFLQPGGIFPGGGATYFSTAIINDPVTGQPTYQLNAPGIGRNVFRGPRYFATDMSFIKRFGLPSAGFLSENAGIDVRFNFFNIFNNLNLSPFGSNSDPTRVNLSNFGTATSALAGRTGEFQIRFSF